MTFTFDDETVEMLRRAASRMKKSQSLFVREAIQDYANRADRLSDDERRRMLKVLDRMAMRTSKRTSGEVDAEISEVRAARKTGGRASRTE